MTRNLRRALLLTGVVTSALLVAVVVLFLVVGRPAPSPPLPVPNGYDDLVKAGQTVTMGNLYPDDLDLDGLRALVAANAEAFRLLRLGLTRRCAVPTDAAIANFGAMSGNLMNLKSLARVLAAEGRLAEMEQRPTNAAHSYVDAISLGSKMSRGGLIINRLVGIACQAIGSIRLVKLLPQLTCEQIRPLVTELEQIDDTTVHWQEILENENRFVRAQMGKYPNPLRLASDLWQVRKVRISSRQKHDLAAARLRLLTTELALRCYRCDTGTAPARLDQLVPQYLQRIPSDPFGGRPLVYRAEGTNWVLSSVGPDAVDGGDEWSGGRENRGSLQYDSPW